MLFLQHQSKIVTAAQCYFSSNNIFNYCFI